ncbi:MAG: hypothetical protein JWQ33_1145 [Ramlibacter sp.]|nr:hypothetical protein [Ramlibacter sp.]
MLFFNEWRVASRAASAAERAVSEAFMLYFNGRGEPPAPEQLSDARRRRAVADDLFGLAMKNWSAGTKGQGPLDE